MRLLNTITLELHEFFDNKIPKYAILSHRWEDGEVTFKDVTKRRNFEVPGWIKIQKSCELARKRGRMWLWIDTCCIDKRSSSELSEAINSMYRWYSRATECYAYLNDVSCDAADIENFSAIEDSHAKYPLREELVNTIRRSQWFTRGWALQELIAPYKLVFIDKDWKGTIGSRLSLARLLSEFTGISEAVLKTEMDRDDHSIAELMSWASKRVCSREEDVAYCLLGIFGVNMPLLYGEGGRTAFRRLQLEILKESNDESIFAWNPQPQQLTYLRAGSVLAASPSMFSGSSAIRSLSSLQWAPRAPYSMTNRGMAFQTIRGSSDIACSVIVPLCCYDTRFSNETGQEQFLAIRLRPTKPREYERGDPRLPFYSYQLLPCPEQLLDRKKRCFIGEQTLIYIKA